VVLRRLPAQRADLASGLQQPGTFLDVGAGVGWLAIEAAQSWPTLHVVGVDSWPPASDLARKNLAQSSVAERVEFRLQRIEELTDEAVFTLAWLPAPFIGEEAMVIVERVYQALLQAAGSSLGFIRHHQTNSAKY
jgi:methylase of polypeptide subunit release factors